MANIYKWISTGEERIRWWPHCDGPSCWINQVCYADVVNCCPCWNEMSIKRQETTPSHWTILHMYTRSSPRHTDGHKEEEACYTWLVQLHIRYEVFVLVVLPPQENSSFWPKVFESSVLLTRSRHSSKLYGRPMRERTKTWLNIYISSAGASCSNSLFQLFVVRTWWTASIFRTSFP